MVTVLIILVVAVILLRVTLPLWVLLWLALVDMARFPRPRKPNPDSWLHTWHW